MKKLIAVLAAMIMVLLCAAVTAENAAEAVPASDALQMFNSEWVDAEGSIKIYPEEDHWRVYIRSGNGAVEWDYSCRYDGEQNALVTLSDSENTKDIITVNDEGSEINRSTVYTDGSAVFIRNENGKLTWKDEKEDVGAGRTFEKIGWFQGTWDAFVEDGPWYELNCFWDIEEAAEGEVTSGYKVEIERYDGEEYTHWVYSCTYNPESNILSSLFGTKEYAEKEGEPIATVYDDGAAEFAFDDEGCILWKDAIENAGEGLLFTVSNG